MADIEKALQTQIANIESRSGKTLPEFFRILAATGIEKHGAMVNHLKTGFGMGHGDANVVAQLFRKQSAPGPAADGDPLDGIYTGKKADLRPLHEAVLAVIEKMGPFEIAPKTSYVSLRRKKQFAMVGPGTKGRLEIGINLKDAEGDERFVAQKPGGMCQFKVWLTSAEEIDEDLVAFVRRAFDAAG